MKTKQLVVIDKFLDGWQMIRQQVLPKYPGPRN